MGSQIQRNRSGIELYHCMDGSIKTNNISFNTNGIYLYGSHIDISGTNQITYNSNTSNRPFGNGIVAERSSQWSLIGDNIPSPAAIQSIHNNQKEQILFESNSIPLHMYYNEIYSTNHNYPYLRMWGDYHGPVIDISENYWSNDFVPERDIVPLEHFRYLRIWIPGRDREVIENEAQDIFDQALDAENNEDYVVAEALLKEVIAEYSDTKVCPDAAKELIFLVEKYNQNYQALEIYYKTFPELRDDPRICKIADYLANICKIKQGEYEEAISYFEDIIQNPDNLPDSIFAVIDAGYTYLLLAENSEKSAFTGRIAWLKPKSVGLYLDNRTNLLDMLYNGKSGIDETLSPEIPVIFGLEQNYPNPFNPSTTISYSIPEEAQVAIHIYNIKGQLVRTLFNDNQIKGNHKLIWDGKNDMGKLSSSGLYLIRIDFQGKSMTRKALMLK